MSGVVWGEREREREKGGGGQWGKGSGVLCKGSVDSVGVAVWMISGAYVGIGCWYWWTSLVASVASSFPLAAAPGKR